MVFLPAPGTPLVRGQRDRHAPIKGLRRLGGQREAGVARRVRFMAEILGRSKTVTLLARGVTPPPPPNIGVWFDLRNPPGWREGPAPPFSFPLGPCGEADTLGAD